jgi:anaerobic magnesium-protoporphyrin IX monomethyl ester cyclase
MRLLLTHGYFLEEDPKEREIMKPYAPLGILYLSSYLRQHGFEVEIYDSTFGTKSELCQKLAQGPAGILGVYGTLMTRGNVLEIVGLGRAAGWRIVLGGPEPANYAAEYLAAGADVIVAGEGEIPLECLVRTAMNPVAWSNVPSIIYRQADGSIRRTPPAPLIADLDAQPWPDRERIDMQKYLAAWKTHHGKGSISRESHHHIEAVLPRPRIG